MTLQRRLAQGIGVILAGLLIFLGFTTNSFHQIDQFITSTLFQEIEIARDYEHLADLWVEIDDLVQQHLSDHRRTAALVPEEMVQRFEQSLERLDGKMTEPAYRASFAPVQGAAQSYLKKLRDLERQAARRAALARREIQRRDGAGQAMITKVGDLLSRYRKMIADFSETLKNDDFQASLGTTSTLMVKISRIERDLDIAENEVALYLSLRNEPSAGVATAPVDRTAVAERVQKRLQAVIGLLSRSIEETTNPLQLRVFSSIRTKIQEFRRSFAELRDSLEHSDSEKLELDDLVGTLASDLEALRRRGVGMAFREAQVFWQRIGQTSEGLLSRIRANRQAGLALLLLVLLLGSYVAIVFPRRIGGPLMKLARAVEEFRLGKEFPEPAPTGTIEIDTLANAFHQGSQRLNAQAALNQKYLTTIRELDQVYRELQSPPGEEELDAPRQRLEKAVNMVLEQLLENIPQIDLVKLMYFPRDAEGRPQTNGPLVRLGETHTSPAFRESPEFAEYAESLGMAQGREESIPLGEGLTGWFFCHVTPTTVGVNDQGLFPVYPITPIRDLPPLQDRTLEKGLRGCLYLEKIQRPNVPLDLDSSTEVPALGALFVYFSRPDVRLSWQDLSFIKIIASQLGSVLEIHYLQVESEKMRRMAHQLQMAREIQENLLPTSIPEVPGLVLDAASKPAADVGGDYYDCFPVGATRLGVVIADAAGKNVPAAILMTVLKTTLSTMDKETMTASDVLTKANAIILRNITSDRFITAMYAIIDAVTGEVELSSAGHNPALIVTGHGAQRAIQEKAVPGLPLGITEVTYLAQRFQLKRGDLLVLYTDGVTDARNLAKQSFGMSGLKRYLAGPRTARMAHGLSEVVQEFAEGMPQQDDITALTIEFQGRAA
jgi:serine phosphatase RsbU (regulator of sigma subunit)